MLDIKFIRENKAVVEKAATDKGVDLNIDQLLSVDLQRRELQQTVNTLQQERNEVAKKKDAKRGKEIKAELKSLEESLRKVEEEYLSRMHQVPNIPSDDTPIGPDETGNKVVRTVGDQPTFSFQPKEHGDLGKALGVIDSERAAEVTGSRFAYLKGDLVRMQFGLLSFVLGILTDEDALKGIAKDAGLNVSTKPFVPVMPPVLIRPDVMQKMARLEPRDERYHTAKDDLYLVGSAEHTMGPMHMGETLEEKDLPVRYVGYSTSFRREAGTYGKDTKGIIRLHQFEKCELESFCLPENSIQEQDFFVAIQEHICQQLELPYQVVQICTGDMGKPDHRQIDIETWMPGQGSYRETHTSDLMTDYQARRLGTKVKRADGSKSYVHMNDATAFAGRTLAAILENYQQEDGSVEVPRVLRAYMGGMKSFNSL